LTETVSYLTEILGKVAYGFDANEEVVMTTRTWDPSMPPVYQDLVMRWGTPVGVEEARNRWGELVAAAEAGTVTLIARERSGPGWAALVPLSEVAGSLDRCPVWPLSAARPKLGDLVSAAADFLRPVPQVLARHRHPAAALIAAVVLDGRPDAGERLDVETLLTGGGTVILAYEPGISGATNQAGDVTQEPWPALFTATACDHTDTQIGSGSGDSIAEALLRLHRTPAADPATYPSEPPF